MIGIFDSGFGGLTILKGIVKKLPQYHYLYLGDNARAPYGNRSQKIVYEFTKQGVDFLFSQGAELIILACNTASALALQKLQKEYLPEKFSKEYFCSDIGIRTNHTQSIRNKNILGVIYPLAEKAIDISNKKRIGVIGTRGTVQSKAYEIELKKLYPEVQVFQQAAPLLVPLIEEGWLKKPEARMILKKYLRPLKLKQIDTLILACTHYPVWQNYIQRIMGKSCIVLDSPLAVADSLADYLKRHPEIERNIKKSKDSKRVDYFTTDDPDRFSELGSWFFGKNIKVKRVRID